MVQFDDSRELHRFREDLRVIKMPPKIDVENSHRAYSRAQQKFTNGLAAALRALRQRSKAHGIGSLRQRLPLCSPIQKIPRDRLGDFITRLTGLVYGYLHRSGRMPRIFLNEFSREAELSEAANRFRTQSIVAQSAGRNSVITEQGSNIGEVGWRSAQLFSGGQ